MLQEKCSCNVYTNVCKIDFKHTEVFQTDFLKDRSIWPS